MKKTLLISILSLFTFFISNVSVAQINTGSPALEFGRENAQYKQDGVIMPTNVSQQDAIDAYNAWKTNYVEECSGGKYRVLFGPDENQNTVSEGIAYGMLLSVYAADKTLFDGLWAYYKQFKNGNGVMDWKISGCDGGVVSSGAATDAELDAAMALIIAAEQWGDNTYMDDARVLIQAIKNTEMASDGQTLNGDQWGNTNTCRNPSYQAPAYYTQFAKVDTDNATFWSTTAVNAASTLLLANRNSTSGLVSNWCDNTGTENSCGNTGSGAAGYGADACRNPWRMATDYLWHGADACEASDDINAKLINFVDGYENQLKGPISNRSVSNPSGGSYVNGSYTTYALATMTDASAQASLNKCYTAVTNLSDVDQYFNSTIRCLTIFTMTGNFWAPGASGFVFPPRISGNQGETNGDGTEIYLTADQDLSSTSATASTFTLYLNGTAESGAITDVSISGTLITLTVASASAPEPGQSITLSYDGSGDILSAEGEALEAFDQMDILNLLEGNETILDDCEDGNELNNVGGIWFTFNDTPDQEGACTPGAESSIDPLTGRENPFQMTDPGYNSDYAVNASYVLGENYTPYNGGSCASWENPSYVGIGTWVDDEEDNSMDWSSGVGVSFWYKGPVCAFQVIIAEVEDFCFHKYDVPECTEWTQITILWEDLAQPTWGTEVEFSAENVLKLQWQFETGNSGEENSTGEFWIDDVRIMSMPPVALTSMDIDLVPDADLLEDDSNPNADPTNLPIGSDANGDTLFLQVTPTPADASYPVVFWSSSDETVATVDYLGRVIGIGYGEATITARSKMHQNVTATYTVTVPAPSVEPESISFDPTSYTLEVDDSDVLIPTFYSSEGDVTETGLDWESSNTSIVSVNSSGTITANAIGGPVTITATSDVNPSATTSVEVTVVKTDVTGLTVDPTSLDLNLGDNATITTTIEPDNATNTNIIWTTSDDAVVTVTDGEVSSVGTGTATVTATAEDNSSVFVEIPVTVSGNLVTDINISPDNETIIMEDDVTLSAEVLPSNASDKTVTWSSSNTDIATVNSAGVVTGVAVGTVTITATANDGSDVIGTATITVEPILVTDITVSPATATVITSETEQLTVSVLPANATDKTVTWSSDNTDVATVDETGLVSAVSPGSAIITATATDGSDIVGTTEITVENQEVTDITVSPETRTILVEDDLQMSRSVTPSNATDRTVTWSSDNSDVATVDASTGLVTGVSVGTVTITATANDGSGVYGTATITVDPILVSSITISPSSESVNVGSTLALTESVSPSNATDKTVTWSSDDTDVATVDATGLVTGVAEGVVTITATAQDAGGEVGTAEITVTVVLPNSVATSESLGFVEGEAAKTLTATISPSNTTDKSVTWSSDDTDVATVDALTGEVTPQGVGSCYVIVTCNADISIKDTCLVTVDADVTLVTGVTLTPEVAEITINEEVTLSASVEPSNATDKSVSWQSLDESVATVSNGVVTGVAIGTTQIVVTTNDGDFTDTCEVTVTSLDVTDIIVSHEGIDLASGEEIILNTASSSITLSAEVLPADATDKTVSWSSDNTDAVTVSNSGVVNVEGLGSAIVTVTANDGSDVTETVAITVEAVPVTGVVLDQTELSLSATSSAVQLSATVEPEDATNKKVSWESSDTDVVTVTNGLVEVVGVGSATITVTTEDGGHQATCMVEVSAIPVTDIIVSYEGDDLASGEEIILNTSSSSTTLSVEVLPTDASDKTVSWSSDDIDVVTVSNSGVVNVEGVGTAIVTVTANDGSGVTETVAITVEAVPVTGITTDVTELTLTVGSSNGVINETVQPIDATNKNVTWSSQNPDVATVDQDGIVTPISEGNTVITVTTEDGDYEATVTVDVLIDAVSVTSVLLNKHSEIIQLNEDLSITATISPSNATNKNVTWESLDTDIAEILVDGNKVTVQPVAVSNPDSVAIVVTTEDGAFTDTCYVTILPILATSLSIDNSITLDIEATDQISATVNPTEASTVLSWYSDDESIATVDNQGNVTPVSEGSTFINATTTDGTNITSNDCDVTITVVHVTDVTVSPTSLILEVDGSTEQLTATVSPSEAYNADVEWTTNMSSVATVSQSGVVTPVGAGTATITVTSLDNSTKKATCTIEVVDKSTLVSAISDAQLLHDGASEGTAVGDYKPGAKADFQLAIDDAQAVVNNASSTQADVDQAILDLDAAETEFNKQKVVDETLIFNAELDNLTYMNTYWFSYSDNDAGGSSIVVPLSTETDPFTMSSPGADGTGSAAMIDYSLMGEEDLGYSPFVGMGMPLNADETPYDLSGSTGIQFAYKSQNAFILEINLSAITDDANYYYNIPASDEWTIINLAWSDFEQYDWGVTVPWDVTDVVKFQWKVQAADGTEGQIWVDDVKIKGTELDLPELNIVDKSELESAIASAEALQTAAVPGDAEGEYPQSAIDDLGAAITVAQTVYDNEEATQDEIDVAVTDLNTAIATFEASVIGIDKSVLETTIANAQTLVANAEPGDADGQYPQSAIDDLETAITVAQSVYDDGTVSQADVTTAITNLNTAIAEFEAQEVVVDTESLDMLIVAAQDFHDNSVEGTADGEYPSGSKETLQQAIDYATSIATNPASTQADINQAESDLESALTNFQESVIGVNKGTLFTKISTATTLHNNSVEGLNMGEYPEGSKADLMTAITTAQSVYDDSQASQDDVNLAVINLQAAVDLFNALEITTDRTVLYTTISDANTLHDDAVEGEENGQYPVGSKADLMTAINAAQTVYDNVSSTQAQIDQAVADLNSAVDTFEALQISIEPLDVSLLSATIDVANSKLDLAVDNTGDEPGNYPLSAVNALLAAISDAENVMENAETQEEINTEVIDLETAIAVFIASEIPVPIDKAILDSLIAEGDLLMQTAETGTEPGQYPYTSYSLFYNSLQSARAVSNDATATQEEVSAKEIELQQAIDDFNAAQISVSVDEVSFDVSVYPNPCVSYAYVTASTEIATVAVVSLLGETVVNQTVNSSEVKIDMNKASSGMYLVNIMYVNGATQTVKLTKK